MALLMRWIAVLLLVVATGLIINPVGAAAAECEASWLSDTAYTVSERAATVQVEVVAWPDLNDWDPGCAGVVLSFPVVPSVRGVEVAAPVEYSLEVRESTSNGLSASVVVVFSAEDIEKLQAGLSMSYTLVADGDWVTIEDRSARFPVWSVGEREGSSVTVASAGADVVVVSAPMTLGQPGLGSTTYTLGRDQEWDAYATVAFGTYERAVLADGLVYWVDRDGSDPDVRVVGGATDGIRAIDQLLGPRPTLGKQLDIIEVGENDLGGYAGRYDGSFEVVQVDASLVQGTLLHEIAHAWLNDATFDDPWMSEGLADYVSKLVEQELPDTDGLPPIEAERMLSAGAPLRGWDSEPLVSDAAAERVEYGYNASLWVIEQIADEVGGPALIRYIGSLVAASRPSGSPVTSAQFLVGLEEDLGFTDSSGAFEDFVFGGRNAIAAARAAAVPPETLTTGGSVLPLPGLGLGVVAVVALWVMVLTIRSLRSRPLGLPAALVEPEPLSAGDDDWGFDTYVADDVLVDSDWSF